MTVNFLFYYVFLLKKQMGFSLIVKIICHMEENTVNYYINPNFNVSSYYYSCSCHDTLFSIFSQEAECCILQTEIRVLTYGV